MRRALQSRAGVHGLISRRGSGDAVTPGPYSPGMALTTDLATRFLVRTRAPSPCCSPRGTSGRRRPSPWSASRRWRPRAPGTPPPWAARTVTYRDEALAHAAADLSAPPISGSAPTSRTASPMCPTRSPDRTLAAQAGLAGCSIEDYDGAAIYDAGLARERGPPRPRRTPAGWSSPPWPRTTSRDGPGPRRHDRPAPVVPGGRAWTLSARTGDRRPTSAGWSSRSTGRSTCLPSGRPDGHRAGRHRRRPYLGRQRPHPGAYGALVEASRELLDQGTYGWWATAAHTAALGDAFD